MNAFDENKHPRGQAGNAGQFRAKENSRPAGSLGGVAEPIFRDVSVRNLEPGDLLVLGSPFPKLQIHRETGAKSLYSAQETVVVEGVEPFGRKGAMVLFRRQNGARERRFFEFSIVLKVSDTDIVQRELTQDEAAQMHKVALRQYTH
jgi:hypothetical protein